MINRHGLKISGLKKAAGDLRTLNGGAEYYELFYNTATGETWTRYHYSIGRNSWTVYHDPDIIKIGDYTAATTMQALADDIAEEMTRRG